MLFIAGLLTTVIGALFMFNVIRDGKADDQGGPFVRLFVAIMLIGSCFCLVLGSQIMISGL